MDSQTAASLESCLAKIDKRCRFHLPVPKHLRSRDGSSPVDAYVQPMPTGGGGGASHAGDTSISSSSQPQEGATSTFDAVRASARAQAAATVAQQAPALRLWTDRVNGAQNSAEEALSTIDQLVSKVQVLVKVTDSVRHQSDMLSSNASSLIVKKTKLELMHNAIRDVLHHFQHVDDLSKEVLHPMLSPYSTRFASMLEEMSDLMAYLSNNQHFKSTKGYASKLSVAQHRAMMCLRDVLSTLFAGMANDLSDTVLDGYEEGQITKHVVHQNTLFFDKLDSSHTAAFRMLEGRCGSLESDIYLQDTLGAYRDARVRLLTPVLMRHVEDAKSAAENKIKGVTVDSLSYLCDLVEEEVKLFNKIWFRDDLNASLRSIVEELSDVLYGQFRAALLGVDTLDDLRRIVGYLRKSTGTTATSSMVHNRSGSSAAQLVLPIAQKMISDTQERVVFRTSMFMRSDIQLFRWSGSASQFIAQVVDVPQGAAAAAPDQTTGDATTDVETTGPSPPAAAAPQRQVSVPPFKIVDRCVYLLDVLYHTVTPSVFAVFAEEAVHWTAQHITKTETQIRALAKNELLANLTSLSGSEVAQKILTAHADVAAAIGRLFLIHHLLILREKLAPYETQLVATEKDLDFSVLMQRRLEIVQSTREAKRDVEMDLKTACEGIIVLFQRWLPAAPDAAQVTADSAADVYRAFHEASSAKMSEIEETITPYIAARATRSVLMKPVRNQALESLEQLKAQCLEASPSFQVPADLPVL